MKTTTIIITSILVLISFSAFTQTEQIQVQDSSKVKTVGYFDMNETKSGYEINNYYVELSEEQVEMYRDREVCVTGDLVVVEGIDPTAKIMVQGSTSDRYFIVDPKITVVKKGIDPKP